jgi:hypothetical protein
MSVLILLLALLWMPAHSAGVVQTSWQKYEGAWFEIRYPPGFRVRPSQPSTSANGYDSAFFLSSDGTIEFYVFAPQWNGTARDIEVDPTTETLVSQDVVRSGSKRIRRVTIKAQDGSYLRSYEDTEDVVTNTRKIFGIKYANAAAYNRYRQVYVTFKTSLIQFAD